MFCKEIYAKKNVSFLRNFFSKTRKFSRYYRAKAINMQNGSYGRRKKVK